MRAPGLSPVRDVVGILADVVRRAPRDVAVESASGVVLTYADLWDEVTHRAQVLDAHAGDDAFVEVEGGRGLEAVLSCVAVVVSGRAYAVVDTGWPAAYQERFSGLLGGRVRLRTAHDATALELLGGRPAAPGTAPAPGLESPLCVFTTSGTTGAPKGVVVPHRAIVRTCVHPRFLRCDGPLRVPQIAPLSWDAGALELWSPLLSGGTCLVPEPGGDLVDVLRWSVADRGARAMWLTSSLFNVVADDEPRLLDGLEVVVTGGERLSPPHVRRVMTALPDLRVVNGYGPVETTVFATTHDIRHEDLSDAEGIPIGRPIRATRVRVVLPDGSPAAAGEPGEVVVGGDGVALGYLDPEAADSRRFVPGEVPGTLDYRTGDLGRVRQDGVLVHLGRVDDQIKVAGSRIDPGGLERVAATVAGVARCAVVRRDDAHGNAVGVVLACTLADGARELDVVRGLRDAFAPLPASARPHGHVVLPELPLTANGKVDREAVRRLCRATGPQGTPPAAADDPVAGGDDVGVDVDDVVREVLGAAAVGDPRPVTEVGVSSLQVVRLATRLTRATGRHVTASDVYAAPSVRALAGVVETLPERDRETRYADRAAEAVRRAWTAERLAPGSDAHVAAALLESGALVPTDRLVAAVAAAGSAYLRGVREIRLLPGHGLVHGRPLGTPPPVTVRRPDQQEDIRTTVDRLARGVHDLASGPLAAFEVVPGPTRTHVVAVLHHVAADHDGLRTLAALLDAELRGDARGAPRPASFLRQPVAWSAQDATYWAAALRDLPASPWAHAELGGFARLWRAPAVTRTVELVGEGAESARARAAHHGVPELAVHLTDLARALREVTGEDDLCVGTMAGWTPEHGAPRGNLAQPLPVRLPPGTREVPDVSAALLEAFAHAAVPFSEVLRVAPGPVGPLGPYAVLLNLLDERHPVGDVGVTSLPPTAPVAELYLEIVRRPGGRVLLRGVAPDHGPYPAALDDVTRRLREGVASRAGV